MDEEQQQPGPGATGPEVIELTGETQVVTKGPRRRTLVIGVVAAVVLAGAAATAVVLLGGEDDPDPAAALRAAQAVVEGSGSYRFEQLHEMSVSTGDPDGSGTDTTTRSLLTGTVVGPDRWHTVQDLDDMGLSDPELSSLETIRIGDEVYSSGFAFLTGGGPAWIVTPMPDEPPGGAEDALDAMEMFEELGFEGDDPFADEMRLGIALQAYLSDALGDPTAVTRVVTELSDPIVEEQLSDGGTVLRAQLAPLPELAELVDAPPVDAVLHLDADGRPVSVRFTAESGSASADVEVTFADWGAALDVEAPPESDIDRTPWISEEGLADLDPALLLAPASVPAPMELVGASVFDGGQLFGEVGDDACPSLSLSYSSEADYLAPDLGIEDEVDLEDFDYLDIEVSDLSCAPEDGLFEEDFDDELAGHPAYGGDGFWEVQFGDVVVSLFTTLDDAAAEAVVASIAPTTADALGAAVPDWVEGATGPGAAWFGFPGSAFGYANMFG